MSAAKALAAYASCDPKADVNCESYLSAFTFGDEFRHHLESTGSTRKYDGPCWSPFIRWDVDRDDLERALADARLLVNSIEARFQTGDELLVYFSGRKGFHVELPTVLWQPEPTIVFNRVAKRFAVEVAEASQVEIDAKVYDKLRAFRAPNSRHPKTGLHKVRLTLEEFRRSTLDEIKSIAGSPRRFELPQVERRCDQAQSDWQAASDWVSQQAATSVSRGGARLNRLTLDFIREGAKPGERANRLFSAAANLAEFPSVNELALALLTEPALDSGLPPSEVKRQIECGLSHRV